MVAVVTGAVDWLMLKQEEGGGLNRLDEDFHNEARRLSGTGELVPLVVLIRGTGLKEGVEQVEVGGVVEEEEAVKGEGEGGRHN